MSTRMSLRNMTIGITLLLVLGVMLLSWANPVTAQTDPVPDNSVDTTEVVDNSLLKRDLASGSVGAGEIRSGAVRKSEIAADSVGRSELLPGVEAALCPVGTVMTASNVMVFDEGVTAAAYSDMTTAQRAEASEIVESYLCLPVPPPT